MKMKQIKWTVLALIVSFAWTAMAERGVREFAVGGAPELDLTNVAGDVTVTQGDGDRIKVTFEKRDDRIEVEFEQSGDRVMVRTIYPRNTNNTRGGVNFTIEFPAEGNLTVESVSGDVDVAQINGQHRLKSVSGDVKVMDMEGDFSLSSVSGDVDMFNIGVAEIEAASISGSVLYDGGDLLGGGYNFSSTSGNISVKHGPAASFEVSGRSLSGNVRANDGDDIRIIKAKYGPNTRLEGSYNGGSVRVRMNSVSGNISLIEN